MAAKANNIELKAYKDAEAFRVVAKHLGPNTSIYVDSNLGNSVRGEVLAKELFEMGFKNVVLTTGYPTSKFKDLPYLKGIIGKRPPWSKSIVKEMT